MDTLGFNYRGPFFFLAFRRTSRGGMCFPFSSDGSTRRHPPTAAAAADDKLKAPELLIRSLK
jgi:hypothetical protein